MTVIIGIITFKGGLNRLFFETFTGNHILGQINQNRARPTAAGDMKSLINNPLQIFNPLDEEVMLGTGPGDTDDVGFLKSVIADQWGRHLARKHDNRN